MTKRKDVIKALKAMQKHMFSIAGASGGISHIKAQHYFGVITDVLELLKEIKPYGGFIEFPDAVGEITGYKAIVERMMDIGILKVEKQEAPMLTRYNWAIKAVKLDDET